jgi:hypothetical protein
VVRIALTIIPLPETLQLKLKPQHLDPEFLRLLLAFLRPALLFLCAALVLLRALCLPVAFQRQ